MTSYTITLHKMQVKEANPIQYSLFTDKGEQIVLNDYLGQSLSFLFSGKIICTACSRVTNKSFNQGYCYPCFKSLAACDMCIMKPETCHYHLGTCREPEWAEQHCMQEHYVYLSNASGLKVGITRQDQLPVRWIDQGAIQAVPLYKVSNRYQAGLIETCLAESIKDKTNWRAMLKGEVEALDLENIRKDVQDKFQKPVESISKKFGESSCNTLKESQFQITYPISDFPEKIKSYNLDKESSFTDTLKGIKGQYLIFEKGVINIRKYSSYQIELTIN